MNHKFDVSKKHKLDNPQRREKLPPVKTLKRLGINTGDIVADIGCGIGYFSLPAAALVGREGKVFALDISEEMLAEVKLRATVSKLENIETVLVKNDKLPLDNQTVTYGLACFVLHEADKLAGMLNEMSRILKDNGRLAIVDWHKKVTAGGPPIDHRIAKPDMENALRQAGFTDVCNVEIGQDWYGLIARKA